jgi:hypothetical protein
MISSTNALFSYLSVNPRPLVASAQCFRKMYVSAALKKDRIREQIRISGQYFNSARVVSNHSKATSNLHDFQYECVIFVFIREPPPSCRLGPVFPENVLVSAALKKDRIREQIRISGQYFNSARVVSNHSKGEPPPSCRLGPVFPENV